jgi:hypothetical protein
LERFHPRFGTFAFDDLIWYEFAMTAPATDKLHRDILQEREEQARLNPDQFTDWDEAKKRIRDQTTK